MGVKCRQCKGEGTYLRPRYDIDFESDRVVCELCKGTGDAEIDHKQHIQDLFERLHDQASQPRFNGVLLIKLEDTDAALTMINHKGTIWGYPVQIDLGDGKRGSFP